MPTMYSGQECLRIDELETHLYKLTREDAKEIPSLIKKRQSKIGNYKLST